MWDNGGDDWGLLGPVDEPDLEAVLVTDDGQGNNDIETVRS